ncbi:MAG: endonuclease III [Clostridiaceae bacterium]|nr:endonuclease III [Clostridiaceae bacterium]
MKKRDKVRFILEELERMYPDAACSLTLDGNSFHFLVRAILSAQCTDKKVNELTDTLFEKYPDILDFAAAEQKVLGEEIRSCGLFRAKSKAIIATSFILAERFGGEIPSSSEDLISLPGVGRKVANLIRGELFGIPGIVVDTHCARVAKRLGLTSSNHPAQIERDLSACIPKDKWITLGHRFVAHGRALCAARRPACDHCSLGEVCLYANRS